MVKIEESLSKFERNCTVFALQQLKALVSDATFQNENWNSKKTAERSAKSFAFPETRVKMLYLRAKLERIWLRFRGEKSILKLFWVVSVTH